MIDDTPTSREALRAKLRNAIGNIPNYVLDYLEISDAIKREWKVDQQQAYLNIYTDKIMQLIATQRAADKAAVLAALPEKNDGVSNGSFNFSAVTGWNSAIDAATAAIEAAYKEAKQ